MTPAKFRSLTLEIPGAIESSHMNHPDFRIGGKIFASLGYPGDNFAMVKLSPDQQRAFIEQAPEVFSPCAGAWGKQGSTAVDLTVAKVAVARAALEAAAQNLAAKKKKGSR